LSQQPNLGLDHLAVQVSRSHTIGQTYYTWQESSEQMIRLSQKLLPKQHITNTREKQLSPQHDLNQQY